MHRGWISIYRKVQSHWIWIDKPFDKRSAWIDLILSANHQDNKVALGNELMVVKRGSFITSELKLMERWGWGKEKTRNFLKLLETDGMIKKVSDRKKTLIEVINYETYQSQTTEKISISTDVEDSQTTNRLVTDHKQTISKLQTDYKPYTNNNDNNVNKNTYMSYSNEYRLAEYLYKYIKKNNLKAKEPNLQKWAKVFDYILRVDGRDLEEVKETIKLSQNHSFWYKNILSPDSLRKQYDRLLLEKEGGVINKEKNIVEDRTQQGYAALEYLKGGIEFD